MTTSYFGRGQAVGFGVESTWGTAVARSKWIRTGGNSIGRVAEKGGRLQTGMGGNVVAQRGSYVAADDVGGGFTVEVGYENMGILWKYLVGDNSPGTTGPSGSEYTHTYAPTNQDPGGLTIESIRGRNNAGTTVAEVFEGCKLNTATISVSPGGVLMCSVDSVTGETSAARTTAGTPSYIDDTPVLHHHAGTFDWNSNNYTIRDFSLSIDRRLSRRPQLGSKNSLEHFPAGPMGVSATITLEVDDALLAAYLANTTADGSIVFTDPASNNTLTFNLYEAMIASYSDPVPGSDMILATLSFTCQSDGTNDMLGIVAVNTQSDAIGD